MYLLLQLVSSQRRMGRSRRVYGSTGESGQRGGSGRKMHSTGSVCGERWQGPRGRGSRWALPRDKRTLGLPELSLQQAREHTAGEINSGKGRKRNRAGVGPGVTEKRRPTSPINALPPAPAAPVSDALF